MEGPHLRLARFLWLPSKQGVQRAEKSSRKEVSSLSSCQKPESLNNVMSLQYPLCRYIHTPTKPIVMKNCWNGMLKHFLIIVDLKSAPSNKFVKINLCSVCYSSLTPKHLACKDFIFQNADETSQQIALVKVVACWWQTSCATCATCATSPEPSTHGQHCLLYWLPQKQRCRGAWIRGKFQVEFLTKKRFRVGPDGEPKLV